MKLITRARLLALAFLAILLLASSAWAQGKYKVLHAFQPERPTSEEGGLVLDAAGDLFGTTMYGGKYNEGQVFKLTRTADGSWKESAIHNFGGYDGQFPAAGLVFDSAGNLYGTTYLGGASGGGTVFKLTPTTRGGWRESVLHSFARSQDGWAPTASLIFDQSGDLYGTTPFSDGGQSYAGTVFKLSPKKDGSWSESVLYTFCSHSKCSDGETPYANLAIDTAGNLYGTTYYGGANNYGTVFQLTPNRDGSWSESVLYSFCSLADCYDGGFPYDGVIFDKAGNLYGTTSEWGAPPGAGVVFKLTPNNGTWSESVLYTFCSRTGCTDGATPQANLAFDTAGNLYGTTSGGGNIQRCYNWGCGTVFKLAPNSKGEWNETVLHAFAVRPGIAPEAGVIFDSAGNLYGTTTGINGNYVVAVFEITP